MFEQLDSNGDNQVSFNECKFISNIYTFLLNFLYQLYIFFNSITIIILL